jgi:hypothetical protein
MLLRRGGVLRAEIGLHCKRRYKLCIMWEFRKMAGMHWRSIHLRGFLSRYLHDINGLFACALIIHDHCCNGIMLCFPNAGCLALVGLW